VAEELGVKPETLTALEVEVPGGRNRRQLVQGVEVLDETYNASPEAMLAALDLLASGAGRRFAALGTMLELGDQSLDLHRRVAARAAGLGLDGLVIVAGEAEGEAMLQAASGLARCVLVRTPEEAVAPLLEWLGPGDRLLLKASRGVALERLIPLLAQGLAAGFNPPPETSSPG
jgi:UDP-N-acetylmuramoyl-tripeptide--D-alanyl-D-alanine ligase